MTTVKIVAAIVRLCVWPLWRLLLQLFIFAYDHCEDCCCNCLSLCQFLCYSVWCVIMAFL